MSSRVGPGWSIAEYSAAPNPQAPHQFKGKTTLYLVNPQGRKFAFFSWPASSNASDSFYLVDWSANGRRVLVQNLSNDFEQISVVTGKVISKFKLPADADAAAVGYTGPADQNILATANYTQDSNRVAAAAGQTVAAGTARLRAAWSSGSPVPAPTLTCMSMAAGPASSSAIPAGLAA